MTKFLGIIVGVIVLIQLDFTFQNLFESNSKQELDCIAAKTTYVPNRNYYLKNEPCVPCMKNDTAVNPNCLLQPDGNYTYCGCEAFCWGNTLSEEHQKLNCTNFWLQ